MMTAPLQQRRVRRVAVAPAPHSAPEVSRWKAAIVHDSGIAPSAYFEYPMSADPSVATGIADVRALTLRAKCCRNRRWRQQCQRFPAPDIANMAIRAEE